MGYKKLIRKRSMMQTQEEMNILVPEKLAEIDVLMMLPYCGQLSLVVALGALSLRIVTLMYVSFTSISKIFILV